MKDLHIARSHTHTNTYSVIVMATVYTVLVDLSSLTTSRITACFHVRRRNSGNICVTKIFLKECWTVCKDRETDRLIENKIRETYLSSCAGGDRLILFMSPLSALFLRQPSFHVAAEIRVCVRSEVEEHQCN